MLAPDEILTFDSVTLLTYFRWRLAALRRRPAGGLEPSRGFMSRVKDERSFQMNLNRRCSLTAVALLLLAALAALPAAADEMWVRPGDKADHEIGDWGVTKNGEARFSFAIPDDLESLTSARVVLLGKKTKDVDWQADLSISQDGWPHDTIGSSLSGTVATTAGDLAEVDVTAVFPVALAGGVDVAGLAFQGFNHGDVYVVGLRLAYERSNPLAGASCAHGEVLVGFDPTGDLECASYDDVLAGLDCPDGELFVGYDESTSSVVCTDVAALLADVGCPAGQVLTGFDSSGTPSCTAVATLLAGVGCPEGQALQAFDGTTGLPICIDVPGEEVDHCSHVGDDEEPTFDVEGVALPEGTGANTDFVFTVTLCPADPANTHTVNYTTIEHMAREGVDYQPVSGTLTFDPGVTAQTITVVVIGDSDFEPPEDFEVKLSNSSGPGIAGGFTFGDILNDD
jgi:hypothetical protein